MNGAPNETFSNLLTSTNLKSASDFEKFLVNFYTLTHRIFAKTKNQILLFFSFDEYM